MGRRELALLVCAALLQGAGQDWYEQADVWQRVQQARPLDSAVDLKRLGVLTSQVQRFLTVDIHQAVGSGFQQEALEQVRPWLTSAYHTGGALRRLADTGRLGRGLRAVLAHHVIFHFNRIGLFYSTQAVLAHAGAAPLAAGDTPPLDEEGCDGVA